MSKKFTLTLAVIAFSGAFLTPGVQAQTAPPVGKAPESPQPILMPPLPMPGEGARLSTLKIRNVKASYLAWKLDPAHNAIPLDLQRLRQGVVEAFGGAKGAPAPTVDPLPTGIEQILAVDPQNILLVKGTPEAVQQLKARVAKLDVPFNQVEIEVQLVQVSAEDAKAFDAGAGGGAPMPGEGTQGALTLHPVRGNFQATLARLINEKKAKILTAPRVVAIDGLSATIGTLGATKEPAGIESAPDVKATTGFQFTVTPTFINGPPQPADNLVALSLTLSHTLQLSQENGAGLFPLQALDVWPATFTVRDGDTWMLTVTEGRPSALLKDANGKNIVAFVKATIVRRFGDDAHVPGT